MLDLEFVLEWRFRLSIFFEAKIFHALAMSANYDPNDKAYRNQLKAAQVLEGIVGTGVGHGGGGKSLWWIKPV